MHSSFDDLENASTLTRSSTGDSGKFGLGAITEAEWNVEGLGKVTALPTRNHWKVCSQNFPFYTICKNSWLYITSESFEDSLRLLYSCKADGAIP
jgi:hypothetical protein